MGQIWQLRVCHFQIRTKEEQVELSLVLGPPPAQMPAAPEHLVSEEQDTLVAMLWVAEAAMAGGAEGGAGSFLEAEGAAATQPQERQS